MRLRPSSVLCCCHLTSSSLSFTYPLPCSIFLPFTLIPTTILRDSTVDRDENPTALPPNFSFSWSLKTFTWMPFRLLISRVPMDGIRSWCTWFQKPNSHLLTTTPPSLVTLLCSLSLTWGRLLVPDLSIFFQAINLCLVFLPSLTHLVPCSIS